MHNNKKSESTQKLVQANEILTEELTWTIDSLLTQKTSPADSRTPLNLPEQSDMIIGTCIDSNHPTLQGRVLISWKTHGEQTQQCWLPTLQGLSIRAGDRVLLAKATNWDEYIVTGVIDGFTQRKESPRDIAAILNLLGDEHLCIQGIHGTKLVEIFHSEAGPVIRILQPDANIELPGKLSIRAEQIELQAVQGSVHVKASDDVIVKGEFIKLN